MRSSIGRFDMLKKNRNFGNSILCLSCEVGVKLASLKQERKQMNLSQGTCIREGLFSFIAASERQHNQDLRRICIRGYEFSNASLFTRASFIFDSGNKKLP